MWKTIEFSTAFHELRDICLPLVWKTIEFSTAFHSGPNRSKTLLFPCFVSGWSRVFHVFHNPYYYYLIFNS